MFQVPTVLVLGAGASWHYGYPTGEALIDEIIDDASNAKAHGYSSRLADSLKFYDPISIDSFLNFWGDDRNIVATGKTHIARALLKCENKEQFHRNHLQYDASCEKYKCRGNWYKLVANSIIDGIGSEYSKLLSSPLNLSIITFNYDVSLEYYLYSRFKRIPTFGPDKTNEFLGKINDSIYHVYGQIGKFTWQGGDRDSESYGSYNDEENKDREYWLTNDANQLGQQIKLIGERKESDYNKIHQKLKNAEKIYFLGFGFNEDNVNILDLAENCIGVPQIFYTNYNNSDLITEKLKRKIFSGYIARDGSSRGSRENISGLKSSHKNVYDALTYDFSLT